VQSKISIFTESQGQAGKSVKTIELVLDSTISYSILKNAVQLSAEMELIKILVKDEEGDLITVSSDIELQEVYRFSFNQKILEIKAICKPKNLVFHRPSPIASQSNPISTCLVESPVPETDLKEKAKEKEIEKLPRHPATCDGCDIAILGVRYKCSICPDYDLCSNCEEINAEKNFHPQNHYFLKINRPLQGCPFKRNVFTPLTPLGKCPFAQKRPEAIPPQSKALEDRVSFAESRIQSLEQKLKDISMMKTRKARFQKSLVDDKPCQLKKRAVKIVTTPPPPVEIVASDITPKPILSCGVGNIASGPLTQPKQEEIKTEKPIVSLPLVIKEEAKIENQTQSQVEAVREEAKKEEMDTPLVTQLIAMGFERQQVLNAIEIYNSDIEAALEHLLDE
jgi:hypothetical protein